MTMLPDPPVPANLDLTDFQFMPVEVRRLLNSETWMTGSGDEKAAAMTLWLESWHQVPAGSLPDNDRMLAHLSQAAGRWPKVRDVVLRGWVKCSDGRLYHHVVCEKAAEAWKRKLAYRTRLSIAREAKESRKQAKTLSMDRAVIEPVIEPVTDLWIGHKGQGQGQGHKKEEESLTTTNPDPMDPTLGASTSRAHTREAPPEISIQDSGSSLSLSSLGATYTDAELVTLQAEFGGVDVAALIPELLAWCQAKAIPPLEQKSAVYGALQQRQAKAELTARARAPPAQIAVSDALRASLQRRRA